MKSWEKVDLDYVEQVISAFLRRVYPIEKHNDQLIIDKHS